MPQDASVSTSRRIDAVDAAGNDKSGAERADLPDRDALLRSAFASDIGVDNDTLSTRDGGYEWYEVAAIDPAHDRTLDEVKDEVTKDWHDDQVTSALASKAADLVKAIDAGETVARGGQAASRSRTSTMPSATVLPICRRVSSYKSSTCRSMRRARPREPASRASSSR